MGETLIPASMVSDFDPVSSDYVCIQWDATSSLGLLASIHRLEKGVECYFGAVTFFLPPDWPINHFSCTDSRLLGVDEFFLLDKS